MDYMLAALSDPRLVGEAVRYVLTRWSRKVESGLRVARRPELRASGGAHLLASLDQIVDALARHLHVLVLDRRPGRLAIGVAEVDLLSALVRLAAVVPDLRLSIAGTPVSFGSTHFKSLALEAKQIEATLTDENLVPAALMIESYRKTAPGRWVSSNDRNTIARAIYTDIFEAPGRTEATDILGGRTLGQIAESRPVDVVYTWVNHADPAWQALYRTALGGAGTPRNAVSIDAENIARFHNKDELRYSLRSVAQNLPWVRRIHVFTNCARPAWLKQDDPRVVWVRHEEVMAPEHLPSFNSHVIESYLHRIPDLAEHFLYLNDDFFVMRPLGKEHFFNANGTSRAQFEPYAMVAGPVRPGDADYLNAARNSARLIESRFGHVPTQLHRHVPYALRRSILAEIESEFANAFAGFRINRFRRSNDVNLTSFLYHHYALATKEATLADCKSILVRSRDIRWRAHITEAANGPFEIVCINEGGDMRPSSIWDGGVLDFMETAFPRHAPWEV
jgi:hypothetical protein